jgi:hypothetical protein
MNKKEQMIVLGVGMFVAAVVLASNPRCNRGCKTLAQHLAEHGIEDFLGGLFA